MRCGAFTGKVSSAAIALAGPWMEFKPAPIVAQGVHVVLRPSSIELGMGSIAFLPITFGPGLSAIAFISPAAAPIGELIRTSFDPALI